MTAVLDVGLDHACAIFVRKALVIGADAFLG